MDKAERWTLSVRGRVIDRVTGAAIEGVQVNVRETPEVSATAEPGPVPHAGERTDALGCFEVFARPATSAYAEAALVVALEVRDAKGELLTDPAASPTWRPGRGEVVIEVKQPAAVTASKPWLVADSLATLVQHEPDIRTRLAQIPNGAWRFYAHPLRTLADLGIDLSPAARDELLAGHPELAAGSDLAYRALLSADPGRQPKLAPTKLF